MENAVFGMLVSQIGYDIGDPKRAVIRAPSSDALAAGADFIVRREDDGSEVLRSPLSYWGQIWGSHWWIADFSSLEDPARYFVELPGEAVLQWSTGGAGPGKPTSPVRSDPFDIAKDVLWDRTVASVALDQLEVRAELARNGRGWKDCGADWREANSHATTVIGLCELLSVGYRWLSAQDTTRLKRQIKVGCDYLCSLQDQAEKLGLPNGALVHEIPNHMVVIPGDVAQASVGLALAGRLLAEDYPEVDYIHRAYRALRYLLLDAQPFGPEGFSAMNHGAPHDFAVPTEWMTRDLLMIMRAAVELWAAGYRDLKVRFAELAGRVTARQVPETAPEGEYFGHFYTFDSCAFTEKANTHHHVGHDTGSSFPWHLLPFLDAATRWFDHPDAAGWKETVRRFAYGFFLPACRENPFLLIPEGYFANEGILFFCGPWHGINTSIAFAAVLAERLSSLTGDPAFHEIAVGNIQWIAGLNCGITRESFGGCVEWTEEVPVGVALPYSQIDGIGNRFVHSWSRIPGTIPNGFSVNPQFQLVVEPKRENDRPRFFTDEGWIPHGAGWVSAMTALRARRGFYIDLPGEGATEDPLREGATE